MQTYCVLLDICVLCVCKNEIGEEAIDPTLADLLLDPDTPASSSTIINPQDSLITPQDSLQPHHPTRQSTASSTHKTASSPHKTVYSLQPPMLRPNLLLENVASQTLMFSAVSRWSAFNI